MGEPWGNAVWQFEGRHLTLPNPVKTQKGRSARLGGSCPTSRVWFGSATRASYESSNWRSYFAPAPGTGMTATGCAPSAPGAKDDSPPFQRWVGRQFEVESPGDGTRFCSGICEWCCPESPITPSIASVSCCHGTLIPMENSDPAITGRILSVTAWPAAQHRSCADT